MNRAKSIALTAFSVLVALAGLGVFASVGLAVVGLLVFLGVATALAAGIATLFGRRDAVTPEAAS